jgi:hypothetical protein
MWLSILGSKSENVEDHFPSRFDILCFLMAKGWDTHHNILFNLFLSWMKIVKHYCLKWFQEHLLVAKIFAFFFLQKFIRKLSQRIDCINDNMKIFMASNPCEMLSKGSPNTLPLESYSVHVKWGNLNNFLKAEFLGAIFISKLLSWDPAEVFNKVNDCIWIKLLTLQENSFDLIGIYLLGNDGWISH